MLPPRVCLTRTFSETPLSALLINGTWARSVPASAADASGRAGCLIRSYLMCRHSQRFHICSNPGNSCSVGQPAE